ncbi:MAG: hypothetical protein FWG68_12015 [Defluviitaleaceae bacterium]|nr:hypothetical protein [Defluviitaleaceae bacterium]
MKYWGLDGRANGDVRPYNMRPRRGDRPRSPVPYNNATRPPPPPLVDGAVRLIFSSCLNIQPKIFLRFNAYHSSDATATRFLPCSLAKYKALSVL